MPIIEDSSAYVMGLVGRENFNLHDDLRKKGGRCDKEVCEEALDWGVKVL
jgi:hypothetical protein